MSGSASGTAIQRLQKSTAPCGQAYRLTAGRCRYYSIQTSVPYTPRPMPTWNPEWASGSCPDWSGNTPPAAVPRHRPHGGQDRFPPWREAAPSEPSETHFRQTFSVHRTASFPAADPAGSAPSIYPRSGSAWSPPGRRAIHFWRLFPWYPPIVSFW